MRVRVTKDTAKVFGCPVILKVGPPTLSGAMMNNLNNLISSIQLVMQRSYFEALEKAALAFEYIKDEDGSSARSSVKLQERHRS
jgi:alanine dehydrogenase